MAKNPQSDRKEFQLKTNSRQKNAGEQIEKAPSENAGHLLQDVVPFNVSEVQRNMKSPELKTADRVFLTKVWGFDISQVPTFGFSGKGGKNNFIKKSQFGDWIILAGTETKETSSNDRGRLLGMIRVYRQETDLDALIKSLKVDLPPTCFDVDGRYRWPYGFAVYEAKTFVERPLTREIFGDGLPNQSWATYARDLVSSKYGKGPIEKIADLESDTVVLPLFPQLEQFKSIAEMLTPRPTIAVTGPKPSFFRKEIAWEDGGSSVYRLKMTGTKPGTHIYKIGYSNDPEARLKAIRHYMVTEIIGLDWVLEAVQDLHSAETAFQAEQEMFRRMSIYRPSSNQEIIVAQPKIVEEVWRSVIVSRDWAKLNVSRPAGAVD
ncbi:MAG: GIY-YIG nuclease family protein [Undibacterium sp.]|nr:GIY-YIG nuclease family protein [Undibacterium sp.]